MPKTLKEKEAELIENPLAHELNFWDFDEENRAIIYVDGSIGCGFEIRGIDNECDSDDEINQRTVLIRGFLNSLSEDSLCQVIYTVDSDYSQVLSSHDKKTPSSLINWISKSRYNKFEEEQKNSLLYRPHIYLFFRFWPKENISKHLGFFQKQAKFNDEFKKNHKKVMKELNQKALDIEAALSTIGVCVKRLDINKVKPLIYEFLNPERALSLVYKE